MTTRNKILLTTILLLGSLFFQQSASLGANSQQVAMLRWYEANTFLPSVSTGAEPYGIAFDGANMWVVNWHDLTVSKISVNDGVTLGTYTVGSLSAGIAFDGANVWVANSFGATVTKIRARDGHTIGTYATGSYPWQVAFDGHYIWVSNHMDSTVTKLRASSGGKPRDLHRRRPPERDCRHQGPYLGHRIYGRDRYQADPDRNGRGGPFRWVGPPTTSLSTVRTSG